MLIEKRMALLQSGPPKCSQAHKHALVLLKVGTMQRPPRHVCMHSLSSALLQHWNRVPLEGQTVLAAWSGNKQQRGKESTSVPACQPADAGRLQSTAVPSILVACMLTGSHACDKGI